MARQIVHEFARGGRACATLLEERAPRTCAAILAAFPHKAEVLHARWAGCEVYLSLPLVSKPPMENQVNRVSAGDVIYAREWEGVYENTGFETMGLFYAAEIGRDWRGEARVNWVARLVPEDLPELEEIALRIWRKGGEQLRMTAES